MQIPNGWRVNGSLPSVRDGHINEDVVDALDEDLIQVTDASGAFTVDVGWYPAAQIEGRFICRIIADNDWDSPLQEFCSRDVSEVEQWIQQSIEDISLRMGEPSHIAEVPTVRIKVTEPPFATVWPQSLEAPLTSVEKAIQTRTPSDNVSHTQRLVHAE